MMFFTKYLKTLFDFFIIMQINVFYDRENKDEKIELDGNSSAKDLLIKMKINPVTVIISKNNDVIVEDEKLNDNDDVKIISVISGG